MFKMPARQILLTLSLIAISGVLLFSPVAARADSEIEPFDPPSEETLQKLNPLQFAGGERFEDSQSSPNAAQLSTPGGIISRFLTFAFPIAGLLLFVLLVAGGLQILLGASNKSGLDAGKKRITTAIVGFLLLFASYWIWQIIEVVFGVVVLS